MNSSAPTNKPRTRPLPNQDTLAKLFHWLNIISLLMMIGSGLQIYNANPVFGGLRLRDLVALAQPKANARYLYFQSADGYYESWDMPSALHPQTLMAYQKNGHPLSIENGAPLRLASPIKLGYKQSKWVTKITLVSELMPEKGYWEDKGYEWFGGL